MSRLPTSTVDPGILAVLHHVGGTWRVLIGSTRDQPPTLRDAAEFPDGEAHRIDEHLAAMNVDRVICVLPASSVVCRMCTLPNAAAEQLDQALRLQAEALLGGSMPEHRTAMAVLPAAPGETSRSGVVLTWPESTSVETPPTQLPVTYAPDIAALIALLGDQRPTDPLLWLDRVDGALALAVTHANGATFRGTREQANTTEDWTQRVTRMLAETALSGGHTGSFVDALAAAYRSPIASVGPNDARLLLPPEITEGATEHLVGLTNDAAWWSTYGIAAGTLRATANGLAPLTTLLETPVARRPSRLRTAGTVLSSPKHAVRAVVVALLLIALTPLIASGLRLQLLKLRHPDIDRQVNAVDEIKERFAIYGALETQAWSMTKLLSDIVCNTPEGIKLETIRLQQSDSSFSVSGVALRHHDLEAPEVVGLMQEQLADSRLFDRIQLQYGQPDAYGKYQFDLSAKVIRPHWRQPYDPGGPIDFEHWPLASRQAGEGPQLSAGPDEGEPGSEVLAVEERDLEPDDATGEASESEEAPDPEAVASGADADSGSKPRSGWIDSREDEPGGGSGRRSDQGERADAAGVTPGVIPEPLSEGQIKAMTIDEARSALTENAEASKRARNAGDTELKDRLKRERDLLLNRLREGRR